MTMPTISIIVPVYKVEKYLAECVNSILSQSFSDFELILVDDGSPDKCPQICDEYSQKDSRVVALHKKNGGQSSARNFGLDHAKGKYVTFVDSDDLLVENALSALYDTLLREDVDVVLGKVIRFTSDGAIRPYSQMETSKKMTGEETLIKLLKGKELNISVCGGIYRKKIFENLRMPDDFICEDWYVMPQIYLQKNLIVFYTNTLVYKYRDNIQSTMTGLTEHGNSQILDVAKEVIRIIKSYNQELYSLTLWSNLKRVWKYVGIIYSQKRWSEEREFLYKVRIFIKSYWRDLRCSSQMNVGERIGVWSFCHCEILCRLLYVLKYSKSN